AALFRVHGPLYAPLDLTTRDEPRLRDLAFAGRDVRNLRPAADSMRLVKDADEVARMRKAVDISVRGHVAAMQAARPGVWEYEIEAALEAEFRRNAADRAAQPGRARLHARPFRHAVRGGDVRRVFHSRVVALAGDGRARRGRLRHAAQAGDDLDDRARDLPRAGGPRRADRGRRAGDS